MRKRRWGRKSRRSPTEEIGGREKTLPSPPTPHPPLNGCWDPSAHDHLNNSKTSKGRKNKRWKEPAYLSFPIVYLLHGKLTFTSPVTGSALGSTARPVWLWAQLPSPSPGFMSRLWGGLSKGFQLTSHFGDTMPLLSEPPLLLFFLSLP